MTYFAIIDTQGEFVGFTSDVLYSDIPDDAVEISDEAHADFLANQGRRKWDNDAQTFVEVTPSGPTEEEHWASLRADRDQRLRDSDWVILRNLETSEPVPPEWLAYRQALRDLPENTLEPAKPDWPEQPTI